MIFDVIGVWPGCSDRIGVYGASRPKSSWPASSAFWISVALATGTTSTVMPSGATGDWAGWDLNVALWTDGAWLRLPPRTGWRAWVEDEDVLLVYDGASWTGTTPATLQNMALLGLVLVLQVRLSPVR